MTPNFEMFGMMMKVLSVSETSAWFNISRATLLSPHIALWRPHWLTIASWGNMEYYKENGLISMLMLVAKVNEGNFHSDVHSVFNVIKQLTGTKHIYPHLQVKRMSSPEVWCWFSLSPFIKQVSPEGTWPEREWPAGRRGEAAFYWTGMYTL